MSKAQDIQDSEKNLHESIDKLSAFIESLTGIGSPPSTDQACEHDLTFEGVLNTFASIINDEAKRIDNCVTNLKDICIGSDKPVT